MNTIKVGLAAVISVALLSPSFASTVGRGDAGKKQLEAPEKLKVTIVNVATVPAPEGGSHVKVTARAKVDAVYASWTGIVAGAVIQVSYVTDTATPRADATGFVKILPVVKPGQSWRAYLKKDAAENGYTIAAEGLSFGRTR